MNRDQKIARARELREQDPTRWSVRKLAAEVDLPRATLHDHLIGREHCREVAAARAPLCPSCDKPMPWAYPSKNQQVCAECLHAGALEKYAQLEAFWQAGKTYPEICDAMGWAKGTVSVMVHRARAAGFDLPYRYTTGKRAGHKFPEQVAA